MPTVECAENFTVHVFHPFQSMGFHQQDIRVLAKNAQNAQKCQKMPKINVRDSNIYPLEWNEVIHPSLLSSMFAHYIMYLSP